MTSAVLQSIQVGLPREHGSEEATDPEERRWTTGFYKEAVAGPVVLTPENLAGDGQADGVHHGGPDKALCVYSADHYPYWRSTLNLPQLVGGAFGENLTVAGLIEADVCIGDVWLMGQVQVQVSQPRQPCWKLARRWRIKTLALQVQETGRTGWYFRVLQPGVVQAGMPLSLGQRFYPEWTVERANRIMHHDKQNLAAAAELAGLSLLSASWRSTLLRRVDQQPATESGVRLNGPATPLP